MHNKKAERKAIRTVRRKKVKDLLAVLFFLLLLPYACSVLTTEPAAKAQSPETEQASDGQLTSEPAAAVETSAAVSAGRYVLWKKENGTWRIQLEEFLVGTLAGAIPGYYREETLKAQAVILRSISLDTAETDSDVLDRERLSYLDADARRELWQENYEEYEAKFVRAVRATSGIVLTFEGKVISPPYFRLSAGQTRNSAQIWEQDPFPWCISVSCPHNLEAEDYLQTVTVKRNVFLKKMAQEGIELTENGARMVLTRDSAGYVLYVECDGQLIEGEKLRTLFELPSSNFSIQEAGKELIFTTRGIGHGVGFDQYAADLLAGAGQDYQNILYTFFEGVTLEKVE